MQRAAVSLLALLTVACAAAPSDTGSLTYRTVDGRDLSAFVFAPEGTTRGAELPAIVLFHGGAWHMGSPEKVYPMCRYFASRGMVAIAVEYRLSDEAEVTPIEALEDAREAMTWTRTNADRLGIDAGRIAAGGYSAGGHLAAMMAMPPDSPPGEGHRPDALVLWFPSLAAHRDPDFLRLLQERTDPVTISPLPNVGPGLPPAIVLQGSRDNVTLHSDANRFCTRMRDAGNRCELQVYKNRGHMFTNKVDDYVDTLMKADAFLSSLDLLQGEPQPGLARSTRAEGSPPASQTTSP